MMARQLLKAGLVEIVVTDNRIERRGDYDAVDFIRLDCFVSFERLVVVYGRLLWAVGLIVSYLLLSANLDLCVVCSK